MILGALKTHINNVHVCEAGCRTLKNVTNIIIGQRIVSVCEADNIIILEDGEIVASGNHKSLYKESNIYKELCDTQLGGEDYGNNA